MLKFPIHIWNILFTVSLTWPGHSAKSHTITVVGICSSRDVNIENTKSQHLMQQSVLPRNAKGSQSFFDVTCQSLFGDFSPRRSA
jgi:hypothetical protein